MVSIDRPGKKMIALALFVLDACLVSGLICQEGFEVISYPENNKIDHKPCNASCAHVFAHAGLEVLFFEIGGSDVDYYACWDQHKCDTMTCDELIKEKRQEYLSLVDLSMFTYSECSISCCDTDNCNEVKK